MNKDIKILTADDSSFMRKVLLDILKEAGFSNFIEAENGKEAIEKYEQEKPDLVLLDIVMPEVDGLEVIKRIGRQANIIVVSAVGQDAMIEDAKNSGAKGYIVKPFEREKVIEEIEKVVA